MRQLIKSLLIVGGVTIATTVAAAGAKVTKNNYKSSNCHSWGSYKFCVDRTGSWQGVMTPSKVRHWTYKYKYTTKYYINNQLKSEYSGNSKYMVKAKDGKTFLYKNKYKFNFSSGCIQTTYTANYQYVNGKIVLRNYKYTNGSKC